MSKLRTIFVGAACLVSLCATAQWQWVDSNGRVIYSDRAPGADVPAKNIKKRPPGVTRTVAVEASPNPAAESSDAAATPGKPASTPKVDGVDKALAEKKKKADEAEAAKRQAIADKNQKIRADNCLRAKAAKAGLDSGVRIARTNAKGEREVLDDAARAAETRRTQDIIHSECGPTTPAP